MNASPKPIAEWHNVDAALFEADIAPRFQPAVLRGLVRSWPAAQAAQASDEAAAAYLLRHDRGHVVEAFVAPPEVNGRFFYAPDMARFNFERRQAPFADLVRFLFKNRDIPGAPGVYSGAAALPECLPTFGAENVLPLLHGKAAVPRIWIGNTSTVATHFDLSDNVACVVAGRRRFTVFPPEQLPNLYVGPLDHTMAGQPASMVSLDAPDFERFPRFREALAAAQTAELGPGDAIYIPSPWWHCVEALSPFNVLVNYWWEQGAEDAGSPLEAMVHGIMAVGALPEGQRQAWRAFFDHYVFKTEGEPADHLDPRVRGILGSSTPQLRARIRQFLLRGLGQRSQ